MIALTKGPEPAVLAQNAISWTETIITKSAAGVEVTAAERTRYRLPQIKTALVAETAGKCAYCESKLLHIHHGDVEHIYPKSLDPLKTFDWSNLTLACEVCNQKKSNKDPLLEHIIDPYAVNPEAHLTFTGALVLSAGTSLGTCTRTILDLNRGDLAERRKEKLEGILSILETIFSPALPLPARQAMYDNLKSVDASGEAPYSAMIKALLRHIAPALPPGLVA